MHLDIDCIVDFTASSTAWLNKQIPDPGRVADLDVIVSPRLPAIHAHAVLRPLPGM